MYLQHTSKILPGIQSLSPPPHSNKRMEMERRNHYKKSLWTEEEDKILMDYVKVHGKGQWNRIAKKTGLNRCGKSCRLRWMNYLSPSVKRGNFTGQEEDLIIRLHNLLGNRWSLIARRVPGRTDNQVKNYWNTHLRKKLGIKRENGRVDVSKLEHSKAEKISGALITSNSSLSCGVSSRAMESKVNEGNPNAADASKTQEPVIDDGCVNSFWVSNNDFELNTPSLMEFFDGFPLDFDLYGL
ncbi:hypothetical protein F0562_004634 [Nyssa sinensis]|uniref:Uncharacterized protein n=1 Tax=Nyssa sinensis TaxID=561372 RepID=A0A5J5BYD6_9ASTE|nr:hypothetical protein F0562_004634 [Nyssa sinensis]